jgi:ATP/maltotriose-dependent transcriptional regulator MalT
MPLFRKSKMKKGQEEFDQGIIFYESQRYKNAEECFIKSSKLFNAADQKKLSKRAEAYQYCAKGYVDLLDTNFLEAIRSFGKANVIFSTEGFSEEAKQARIVQAQTQGELAKIKAQNAEFIESARLFESAAALYATTGMELEAARARARSYVQRGAAMESDFDKAYYLEKAVEEFKKGREDPTRYEAHALYRRAKALISARENVKEVIDLLAKAHEKYHKIGNTSQTEKVRLLLKDLTEQVKAHPSEFGV